MPAPASVHYRRDLLGRLVAAGTSADAKDYGAWSYKGDGALASETLRAGEGATIARSFATDGLGRPVSIDEPALTQTISYRRDGDAAKPYADGGIAAETVIYKPAGFPSGTIPPSSTTTYTYDGFGRLTTARSAQRAAALNVDAAYDGNGNLDSLTQAGTSRAYDYRDGTNRLASVAGQAYAHDAAGAVTSASGTSLVRDPATGQMCRGTKGGQTLAVLRDGRGRIALATQGMAKRLTVRDGQGAILVEREGASLAALHLHGASGRIGLWTGTAYYAISKDLRGSTRILTGADGKAAAWLSYCAYGVTDTSASSTGTLTAAIRQRYTGQDWLEPLALYDYGARLYDPALGRFLSPDPKDETPSPYMYVAGDPVNVVDPEGAGIVRLIDLGKRKYYLNENGLVLFIARRESEFKDYMRLQEMRKRYEALSTKLRNILQLSESSKDEYSFLHRNPFSMADSFPPERLCLPRKVVEDLEGLSVKNVHEKFHFVPRISSRIGTHPLEEDIISSKLYKALSRRRSLGDLGKKDLKWKLEEGAELHTFMPAPFRLRRTHSRSNFPKSRLQMDVIEKTVPQNSDDLLAIGFYNNPDSLFAEAIGRLPFDI